MLAGIWVGVGCLPVMAQQAVPASPRAIQGYCNDRVQNKEEPEVSTCVARENLRLRERTVACSKQSQLQNVRTAELAAFMEKCQASTDLAQFQQQQVDRATAEGQRVGREYYAPPETLQSWTNFDFPVAVRITKVLFSQWVGGFAANVPDGAGELIAEVQYIQGQLMERPFVGVIHLQGTMQRGRFVGPVKALKHVAWENSKDRADQNDFIDGRSAGLVVESSGACNAASIRTDDAATARFYGACRNGMPYQGLVVHEYRGVAFDLACLSRGVAAARGVIDAFQPCASFWRHLPRFCQAGDYSGQCKDGSPHGVGIVKSVRTEQTINRGGGIAATMPNLFSPGTRAYYLKRGMFANGELTGFGYSGHMEGCGMAGCTGDRGEQLGWFEAGSMRFSCNSPQDCSRHISGLEYLEWVKRTSAALAKDMPAPASLLTFEAAIDAFRTFGQENLLRRASELARTAEERAALEYELLRIAGFDKAFSTTAALNAGGPSSVTFDQSEKVLGLLRSTDGKVPLQVTWRIRSDPDAVTLRHGKYLVNALIGVRIRMKRITCVGTLCNEQYYNDVLQRRIESRLHATNREVTGQFDLRHTATSASVTFGVTGVSELVDATPFVRIESVTPTP